MKILLKITMIIVGLSTVLISGWYLCFWNRFSTLQESDRQIILNSFKEDSDLKGYSDDAKMLLEQDFLKIKNLTTEEKESFRFWLIETLKQQRITMLSKTKEEFVENSKKHYIYFRCSTLHIHKLDSNEKYNFIYQDLFEKDGFKLIYNNLEKKNFRFLSFDEIFDIQNPDMDFEKCEKLEKDFKFKNKESL